jgi:hypothetical protein
MEKSICFAYYVDGKFVGWYADSFGSCRNYPKLYSNTEKQIHVVYSNFMRKMAAINTSTFAVEKSKVDGLAAVGLAIYDSEELLRGKKVELRVVECPEYDGPNPNFNRSLYEKACKEMLQKMKESGVLSIPGPSKERSEAVQEFYKENPYPKAEHWIYADYNRVAAWAKNEPKDFIKILTY